MKRYLLAVSPPGASFVLGLEARTVNECKQVISWMRVGQFNMDYEITTYDAARDCFVAESGVTYQPDGSPYTATAWAQFRKTLEGRK